MTYAYFRKKFVSINEAKVSITTHAFNYGTGIFEGIKGYYNEKKDQIFVFRLHKHYERMIKNCKILKMYLEYSVDELAEITCKLIEMNNYKCDVYIRPIAYKSLEKIGVRLPEEHDLCIYSVPMDSYFKSDQPLKVCISSWKRIDDNAIPGRGKICGSYVNSALAAQEARDNGFDEAIFLNEDGHVSEGPGMNLFIIKDCVMRTPPVTHNILEGITRESVIEIASEELGISTFPRAIDRSELYQAEELFFCGTAAEIAPIGSVDHRPIGNGEVGKITKKLRSLFFKIVRGNYGKYSKWLTEVYKRKEVQSIEKKMS